MVLQIECMKIMSEDELREVCLDDLPLSFYKEMVEGVNGVYKEADAVAYNTPSWGESQGDYIAPHLRLILFENLFHRSAEKSQIIAASTPNVANNYRYTLVRSNRLVLTASCVDGKKELPRPSVFRSHLADINSFLNKPTLPATFIGETMLYPVELYAPDEIYGVILHGKSYIKTKEGKWIKDAGKNGFMRIAFMNEDMTEYAANFDFFVLYTQAMARRDALNSQVEDKAVPKLKSQQRKEKYK